jgi:hypothetical protein
MPYTYRDYPVREVAIAVEDCRDNPGGGERKKSGDIVNVRAPKTGMGNAGRANTLRILVEGPDTSFLDQLTEHFEEGDTRFDKRRYCIPLHRLPAAVDVNRVKDISDIYQPFLPIDEDTNLHLGASLRPLRIEGLIFDKTTGKYL